MRSRGALRPHGFAERSSLAGRDGLVVPGGLAEMSMVALGIGQDVAFVATHHLFRIAFIVILAPLASRLIRRWF